MVLEITASTRSSVKLQVDIHMQFSAGFFVFLCVGIEWDMGAA